MKFQFATLGGMALVLTCFSSSTVQAQDQVDQLRVDCRYHATEATPEVGHCYASANYDVVTPEGDNGYHYSNVRFGVGCDQQTIYNDRGRIHIESVGERISPRTAAFPAVEILFEGSLSEVGTYDSVLDIAQGRISGKCYVHRPGDRDALPFD